MKKTKKKWCVCYSVQLIYNSKSCFKDRDQEIGALVKRLGLEYNFQRRGIRDWVRNLRLADTGSAASMKDSSSNGRM